MTSSDTSLPFVSVIVPVLNMPAMIRRCISALLVQTYPREKYEILIVDNGSTDETPAVIREYPVILLVESGIKSPYAARNLGLKHAKGEVIALTDADCAPMPVWIQSGVAALRSAPADLVGGHVQFLFSSRKTAGEIYDSLANLEMKKSITQKGEAKTGNLIAKRTVFEEIGEFPGHMRSGGDKFWTGRASRAGFSLVYRPDVVVGKQARKILPLLRKSYRIGRGHPNVWVDRGRSFLGIMKAMVRDALPPTPGKIRAMIAERGSGDMYDRLGAIWLVAWGVGLASTAGRVHGFLTLPFGLRR